MDNDDWSLSSIVRSCKSITFTNASPFCETPTQNLTTTITTTTNSIVPPINSTPSSFDDSIFNQENSSVVNTQTMDNDWDLSYIVRSCKATNFTNPSTFCETPPQTLPTTITTTITNSSGAPLNTTPSCLVDFTSNQENSQVSLTPLKPNDYICLNKLRVNFNSTTCDITPPTTFTTPTTTINNQTITPTHQQQPKCRSRIRKNKNLVTSVCHVKEDQLSEDQWKWRKYGQKPVKGSPHSRSYYKCSSSKDCPAKKQIEKSKTEDNTYVVTYRGKHNHQKLEVKQNFNIGTSHNKSSEARLPISIQAGSSQNFKNLSSPNVVMVRFDQSKSSNAQVLDDHSKTTNPNIEFNESQLLGEVGSSQNVQNLDSHDMMMLQRDEPERSNAQIFLGELEIPYSETDFTENNHDDDDILIPNMLAMSQDFLQDFNHLNGHYALP